jgi:hypothetical protein
MATHKLVKKTAKDLAGAFYDNMDVFHDGRVERTTQFRTQCPDQHAFIEMYWTDFVKLARKILAHMLTEPGRTDGEKDQIYDALLNERGQLSDEQRAAPSILRLN